MARKTKPVPDSRGERVQQIKDALERRARRDLTVIEVADLLNDVARELGFEERWNGSRFSKMVHGQEPALEDAACLIELDPDQRGWDWLVFGPSDSERALASHPETIVENAVQATVDPGSAQRQRVVGARPRGKLDRD